MPDAPSPLEQRALDSARASLIGYAAIVSRGTYTPSRVHDVIAWHLGEVLAGRIRRLWIRCPPRHGKSELVSRLLPAWYLGHYPDREVMLATHTADLARELGTDARDNMADPMTRLVFPAARIGTRHSEDPEEGAAMHFRLTAGGSFSAGGVGKKIPGRGANLLVVDDPTGSAEEADSPTHQMKQIAWYATSARTRLAPGGAIVGIDTSWGQGVLGSVLCAQPGWHVLTLPAIREDCDATPCCARGDWRRVGEALWPERWPLESMRALAAELAPLAGARTWETLFQQRAVSASGEIIRRAWAENIYIAPPASFERSVIYWDPKLSGKARGARASWAVGLVWGQVGARFYLLDAARMQADFPIVLDAMADLCRRWPDTACYVEPTASGPAAVEVLRREMPAVLLDEAVRGSKEERLGAVAPAWEAGNVWLPDRTRAPWIDGYREEIVTFPKGTSNDYVDATSGALRVLQRAKRREVVAGMPLSVVQGDWTDRH